MVCVNTYSLVGEYALDMHHIFSQQKTRCIHCCGVLVPIPCTMSRWIVSRAPRAVCKQIWLREITGGRSYVELRRCPPLLSLLHNGTGYAHTWTSAQGWQRIRRTCDNQVKLKLDGLQALFYADLAASIRSSTEPLAAAHAGGTGGRGGHEDDCNITAADLRLVLTGR